MGNLKVWRFALGDGHLTAGLRFSSSNNTRGSTIKHADRDGHGDLTKASPPWALVITSRGSASKAGILHLIIKVMDGTTIYSGFYLH